MSIECLQRSPSTLPSSSSPVHFTVGGHHHPPPPLSPETTTTHHSPFQVVAGPSTPRRSPSPRPAVVTTMTRTDLDGDCSVTASPGTEIAAETTTNTTATTANNNNRPQIPPRPVGKPVPPPRRSSAVSSSSSAPLPTTLTSNNDNNNNNTTTNTITPTTTTNSSKAAEHLPPKQQHQNSKKPSTEPPSSEASSPPFTGTTTGSVSHASTSGSNTPPVIKWGRNFHDLIKDKEGLNLFTRFLQQEAQSEDLVHFYYTCESIKCAENRPHVARLARAILKKFIINGSCSVGVFLSEAVKSKLVQDYKKLNENRATREAEADAGKVRFTDEFYMNLFNDAQREIFSHLSGPLYEHFIRHDIYLRHLSEITFNNEQTIVYSEAPNAEATPSPSNGSLLDGANSLETIDPASQLPPSYESFRQSESPYEYGYRSQSGFVLSAKPLPTVSEQDEETGSAVDLRSDDEVASTLAAAAATDVESSYQQMFHSSKETAARYLASAEDSGIETQVSLVPSERNVSNRNRNHSGKSRSHSPTVGMGSGGGGPNTTTITSLGRGVNFQRVLNNNNNIGHHDGGIKYQSASKVTMTQEMFHQSYLNSKQQMAQGYPAPHPYHVSSFSVVPPSTRDSEIQSISSNSTSESYALLNYSRDRSHHPNKSQPLSANSKGNPNFPPNALRSALHAHAYKHGPQQQQHQQQGGENASKVPDPTTNTEAFGNLLIKKILAAQKELLANSQIIHKLREVEKESEPAGYNQGLKDALKNKKFNLKPPDDKDDQSILDNHCAQVFDMTPSNSGTPTTAVQPPPTQASVMVGGGVSGSSGSSASVANAAYHHHNHHSIQQQQQQQLQNGPYSTYRPMPAAAAVNGLHHYPGAGMLNRLQNLSLSSNPNSLLNGPNPTSHQLYLGANNPAHSLPAHPPPYESSSLKTGDVTVTVSFSDDSCPYKLTLPRQPNVTLAQFKAAIPTKKGKVYVHYFKRKCTPLETAELNSPFVFQAIEDDAAFLPQYDGKIFAKANLQQ